MKKILLAFFVLGMISTVMACYSVKMYEFSSAMFPSRLKRIWILP